MTIVTTERPPNSILVFLQSRVTCDVIFSVRETKTRTVNRSSVESYGMSQVFFIFLCVKQKTTSTSPTDSGGKISYLSSGMKFTERGRGKRE